MMTILDSFNVPVEKKGKADIIHESKRLLDTV